MKRKISLSITLICLSQILLSQNLTCSEMIKFIDSDIKIIQKKLNSKSWTYKESIEGDETHYKVVTWVCGINKNGAEQYFTMYLLTEQMKSNIVANTNCQYSFTNKKVYDNLIKELIKLGFKEGFTHTKANSIIETYALENKFGFRIEMSTSQDNITTYEFHLLKYKQFNSIESKTLIEEKK